VRYRVLVVVGLVLALGLGLIPAPSAVAKPLAVPASISSATIDAHLGYQPQTTCSPSAKPGAKALLSLLINTWGGRSSGISRGCKTGGRSEHKEGRALDWHMSAKKAKDRRQVSKALRWITANHGEVARRLGIMYVIWNQQIWSTYYPELGWRKMADRGSATANHKDHVHISLSWDGAYKQTSWWTGKPVTAPLNSRCGVNGARACRPTIKRSTRKWPYRKTVVPATFTPAPWTVPGIGGSPQVGRTLRAVAGSWVPTGATVTYQWMAGNTKIVGATSSSFTLTPKQVRRVVSVRVTATSSSSVITKTSKFNAEIVPARMRAGSATVVGKMKSGATLSIKLGAWRPAATSFSYVWLRDGKPIKKATKATYQATSADRKHRISVRVTGHRYAYYPAVRISKARKVS
jgi:hypothetical protein